MIIIQYVQHTHFPEFQEWLLFGCARKNDLTLGDVVWHLRLPSHKLCCSICTSFSRAAMETWTLTSRHRMLDPGSGQSMVLTLATFETICFPQPL